MCLRARFPRAAVALMALPLLAAGCGFVAAQTAAGPMDPKRLFATSRPGTVMVVAEFNAHLTVPYGKLDDARLDYLKSKAVQMVTDGQLPADTNTVAAWAINQILGDPLSYFQPTEQLLEKDFGLKSRGSGFVISPQGYVVTNAHVAAPNEDDLKQQLATEGLKEIIDQDVKSTLADLSGSGWQTTPELTTKVGQAVTTYDTHYLKVTKLSKAFHIEIGAAIPGVAVGANAISAEVSAAGTPFPGKDVAVLKVEKADMLTVPLGDDSQVNPGDRIYVLGYPGAADVSDESLTEPTLTSGTVSARKVMPGGFSVIQFDAPITHGNSGGPVFDTQGRVIGIATAGSPDDKGNQVQGFNFAIPISVTQEFIARAGAHPTQGLVSQKYNNAIALYDKQWYRDAFAEFQQVNSLSPGHPYVQDYITKSQTAIVQGKDRSNEKYLLLLLVALPLGLLVLGGGTGTVVILRARRRPGHRAAVAAEPQIVAFAGEAAGDALPAGTHQSRYCPGCGNEVSGKAFCDRCGRRTGNIAAS